MGRHALFGYSEHPGCLQRCQLFGLSADAGKYRILLSETLFADAKRLWGYVGGAQGRLPLLCRFVQAGFGRRRPGRRRAFESLVPLSAGRLRKLFAKFAQGAKNSDSGRQHDASSTMQDEPPLKVARRTAPQSDASALGTDELPLKGGGRRAALPSGVVPSKDKQVAVPPPSPFIMLGKDKPKRSVTKTSGNERGTTPAWIPPPSPYARPASSASSAKPKSPHRASIPPPSPVAKPPSLSSQPSASAAGTMAEADVEGDGAAGINLPEDSSKTKADSMLNDIDDILGLLD